MERTVGISVRQLVNDEGMAGTVILAGESGIDRIIRKANIYADKDILDWLAPNEILLMTELNLEDWDDESFIKFLHTCQKQQLAAIGIKFTKNRSKLSDRIILEADRLKLPLLAMNRHLSIADTSSLIFRKIFAQQAETLEKHGMVHEQLLKSLLEDGKIEAVLGIIQQHVNSPLGFKFADLNTPLLICEEDEQELKEALLEDMVNYDREIYEYSRLDEDQVQLAGRELKRFALPVIYKDSVYGVLFCWGAAEKMDSFTLYSMETAATNIALLMLQEISLREVEVKHSSEYFSELLHPNSRQQALEKARIYRLNPDNQYAILILRIMEEQEIESLPSTRQEVRSPGRRGRPALRKLSPEELQAANSPEAEAELFRPRGSGVSSRKMQDYERLHAQREFIYNFLYRNIRWAEQTMRQHRLNGLISSEKNEIRILLDCEKMHGDKTPLLRFAQALQEGYQALLPPSRHLRAQLGIGKIYPSLKDIAYSFREASKTIDLGVHLYSKPILHFDDLGIFKIFIHVTDVDELEDFYRLTLTPLLDYDRRKQTQLLSTLVSYFNNNCNVRKTSEDLFTHYNTVLYRLDRIQEITGMNLDNSNDRLNLEMALKMRSLFVD